MSFIKHSEDSNQTINRVFENADEVLDEIIEHTAVDAEITEVEIPQESVEKETKQTN